jgi:hypothetical protein
MSVSEWGSGWAYMLVDLSGKTKVSVKELALACKLDSQWVTSWDGWWEPRLGLEKAPVMAAALGGGSVTW